MKMGLILDDSQISLTNHIKASQTFANYIKSKTLNKSPGQHSKIFERIQDLEVRGYLEEIFKYYERENDKLTTLLKANK